MRKIAIDTNIYSAFKKNDLKVIRVFQHCDIIAMDTVVLAELLTGFKLGRRETENRSELEAFLNNSRVTLLNHDENSAEFYADIFCKLKKKGRPIPTNDIWIAATARQYGLALFTFDAHFNEVDGLLLKTDY